MKDHKVVNWVMFAAFVISSVSLWYADYKFRDFGPPGTSAIELEIYHRVIAAFGSKSANAVHGFALAVAICLGATQWRMGREIEQLRDELRASKPK